MENSLITCGLSQGISKYTRKNKVSPPIVQLCITVINIISHEQGRSEKHYLKGEFVK